MLDELAAAIDEIALALACLGEAYEVLDDHNADRLEAELFGPAQHALGRARRTHAAFAEAHGMPPRTFATASAGHGNQGAHELVGRAAEAAGAADHLISELQDSMLPVEVGDQALRAGLAEARELIGRVPGAARAFLRTLGR